MSKGLNIGFIGVGQCGGNIVNEFAKLGYTTIAINTAQSDLDKLSNIHIENRLLINFGIQGAGKNPEIGENAFIQHNEEILKLVEQAFSDMDIIYVCAGLGGGTGSGIAPIFTQVLLEMGYNVGMMITLPTKNESPKVQLVALEAFQKITEISGIKSIFIIDNEKSVNTSIGVKMQYNITNVNVAKEFDSINEITTRTSDMAFDARDLITLLEHSGISILTTIEIEDIKSFPSVVAQSVTTSIKNGLFADSELINANGLAIIFETKSGGGAFISQDVIQKIQKALGNPFDMFYAIYEDEDKKQDRNATLKLLITGLPIPKERLDGIEADFEERQQSIKEKQDMVKNMTYESKGTDYLHNIVENSQPQTPPKTSNLLEEIAKRKKLLNQNKKK